MPLVACPHCSRQISDAAPACPHCGRPNPAAPPAPYSPAPGAPSAAKSGTPVWLIVLLVAGGGLVLVVFLGIVAAIAIPRFSSVSKEAKNMEAETVLKQLHTLQESHRLRHDAYAADLSQLEGWTTPPARYFEFGVSAATDSTFCLEAAPTAEGVSSGLEPRSMDQTRTLYEEAGCAAPAADAGS